VLRSLLQALPQQEALSRALQDEEKPESSQVVADRDRRMKWWHEAKFGMFIHWGLYSVLGHHEWRWRSSDPAVRGTGESVQT
jgi:hypothetical protein